MNFLRRLPTSRLLALCIAAVLIAAGGTAVAVAVSSSAPKPPAKPLAQAIHDAAAAPSVKGVTARISFTNKLIDDSSIEGGNPLLKGATGRLWATKGHLRLELQSSNGDAQIVASDAGWWVYDAPSNTVYRGTFPRERGGKAGKDAGKREAHHGIPTVAEITKKINEAAKNASLSGAIPSTVAGQSAYTLRVGPKHDGGLLGAGEVAWDAVNGVPLRAAIYAQGSSSPVIELTATDISFGNVPASDFAVKPPSSAKVVQVSQPSGGKAAAAKAHARHAKTAKRVRGLTAVQSALPFKLSAPAKLAGLPRRDVSLLDFGGQRAALVAYGQNLGGIAVIERRPGAKQGQGTTGQHPGANHGGRGGLRLPTISINGATGQELATALGTVVQFDRAGVSYVVIGSVPPQAAEAAARGL